MPNQLLRYSLVAAVCIAAAGCGDSVVNPGSIDSGERATSRSAHSQGRLSLDEHFLAIANQLPGFGGFYFESPGQVVIALKDQSKSRAAISIVEKLLTERGATPGTAPSTGIAFRIEAAQFDFPQLHAIRHQMDPVFRLSGVVFTDVDEVRNRVVIAVSTPEARSQVEAAAQRMRVPREAISIIESAPFVLTRTLTDPGTPEGGLGIDRGGSGELCTLGFNARLAFDAQQYFVTNAHCTETTGALDGSYFYQPTEAVFSNYIGREVLDPAFTSSLGNCPDGYVCRYSDAALVLYDGYKAPSFGTIARTLDRGSLTIDDANPRFTIDSTGQLYGGERVEKMGATTGWTTGVINGTCLKTAVEAGKILLCQYAADMTSSGGDSGAPVFSWGFGNTVALQGVMWGRTVSKLTGTDRLAFSPMSGIQADLGTLTVVP